MNGLERFAMGWIRIVDGLLLILSLGFWRYDFGYRFAMWTTQRRCK